MAKRMSADEKRKVILDIYHSTKSVFVEKEILTLAAKAGVNANTYVHVCVCVCLFGVCVCVCASVCGRMLYIFVCMQVFCVSLLDFRFYRAEGPDCQSSLVFVYFSRFYSFGIIHSYSLPLYLYITVSRT